MNTFPYHARLATVVLLLPAAQTFVQGLPGKARHQQLHIDEMWASRFRSAGKK
ncbi:hypothetical protein [Mesorhizobium sp.]|uniref:hypothetical protein n=1 Tax=Mesorhizobium sp. TaxID=1871066 RepID=UPI00257BCB1C|nr:hypothetical protein [Mesorhizobium sp.]